MIYRVLDLFCGCGGSSGGLIDALTLLGHKCRAVAINHWPIAIASHSANFPHAEHILGSVEDVDPLYAERALGGKVDILVATASCVHFSNARGGKPREEQQRYGPWAILEFVRALRPKFLVMENVREIMSWGPLDDEGKPIASRKGETFRQWIAGLRSLGYGVDHRILNAADWGDFTIRRRFICVAPRIDQSMSWPVETHSEFAGQPGFEELLPWEPARKILDFSLLGDSIFDRKKPLSPTTMARILVGLERFCGEPFLVGAGGPQGAGRPRSVDVPINTLLTQNHKAVVQPLLSYASADSVQPVGMPFLMTYHGSHRGSDDGTKRVRSINVPIGTLDTSNRFALLTAFLFKYNSTGGARPIDAPLGTLTTKPRYGLVTSHSGSDSDGSHVLDVRMRMLQTYEQAAAHSFPAGYVLAGTQEEQTKLIGNSIPRKMARAIFLAVLGRPDVAEVLRENGLFHPAPYAYSPEPLECVA